MSCNCNCILNCTMQKPGLTPHFYYRKKCECYVMELETKTGKRLWGMHSACDNASRELYSHIVGRNSNITNLVPTVNDADELFEYFKIFANVWAYHVALN